ncbi:MAG: hypothetical protein AB1486_02575 [Planctomycetota bacterium]
MHLVLPLALTLALPALPQDIPPDSQAANRRAVYDPPSGIIWVSEAPFRVGSLTPLPAPAEGIPSTLLARDGAGRLVRVHGRGRGFVAVEVLSQPGQVETPLNVAVLPGPTELLAATVRSTIERLREFTLDDGRDHRAEGAPLLSLEGPAVIPADGLSHELTLRAPGAPELGYLVAAAFEKGPTPLPDPDPRTFPLRTDDPLFRVSLREGNGIFAGLRGVLDARGCASVLVHSPSDRRIAGLTIYLAAVVLDPHAPSGILSLSEPFGVRFE